MNDMQISNTESLGEWFFKLLKKYGNRVLQFLDDTNEINTFSDILIWSIRTAINLKRYGITQDDIISSCSHNQKHSWIPFFASQFLGAKTASFDPNLPELDTIHLLKLIEPKILFVSEEALEFIERCLKKADISTELVVFGYSKRYTQFSEYIELCTEEKDFIPAKIKNVNDTAVILFSSGTTGSPKGICLSHKALISMGLGDDTKFNVTCQNPTVVLLYTTIYWVSALCMSIRCTLNGESYVMVNTFDPLSTWKLIEKYKVTLLFLAPYNAIEFLKYKADNVDTSSLELFLTGSCAVPEKLMLDLREALPNSKILNGYGQSEAAGLIAMFDPTDEEEYKMQIKKPLSSGKFKNGMQWKIVDVDTEEILGPHQQGEIRYKDKYMFSGYYKMDSITGFDSDGYFKTGDIGYYDEDKCLYVMDRIKEVFKYRGWHILPAIIESVLLGHPVVKEAVVIGIPHKIDIEHPMGIVVLFDENKNTSEEEIRAFVDKRVSEPQKLRGGVKIVDSLPKTPTGKVRRKLLKNMILA